MCVRPIIKPKTMAKKEKMTIGEVSKPRFEFRSFGQCFCEAHKRMARLSAPVPEKVWERLSDEIYIISRKNDINNTKIRDGKMDIKTFVQSVDGLEQWNPLMKGIFNVSAQEKEYDVFLLIGQSNMAGRGYMIEGDEEVIHKNVCILDSEGNVVPATNPLNQYSSIRKDMSMQRISPAFGFAQIGRAHV